MKGAYKLVTIAGIEIGVHYTWLFAFALFTWTLAMSWFPSDYPDWHPATYWVTAAVATLVLFGSVLVHELAHSIVAITLGMPVHGITLFIFGGVSNIGGDSRSARDEFLIAVVGPVSSITLSVIGILALRGGVGGDDTPVEGVLIYFALANMLVGIFNLLPGFPLDGGRVLRAIIWAFTGNVTRATRVAAGVGIGFGWLLVGAGAITAISGDLLSGLWMAFIGWYLKDSAIAVRRTATPHPAELPVRLAMMPPGRPARPDTPLDIVLRDFMLPFERRAIPVVYDYRVVGLVTFSDLQKVDQSQWPYTRVSDVMSPQPLIGVSPEDSMSTTYQLMRLNNVEQILVFESNNLVGIAEQTDILRMMAQ